MRCSEATKLLPGLALGDLDAEPARELETHLQDCPACRAGQSALAAAATALRKAPAVGGSAERRQGAVAAMTAAYGERDLPRPAGKWRFGAAAAALLLAGAAGWAFFRPAPEIVLRTAQARGRAGVYDAKTGRWAPLGIGTLIRSGDRVVVQEGSAARFDLEGGTLHADQDTAFTLAPGRVLMLDGGRLGMDLREASSRGLVLSDASNNRVELKVGTFEARLRDVVSVVGGETAVKIPFDPEASVRIEDRPFWEAAAEIVRRTSRIVVAGDPETGRRKVTFYGRRAGNDDLFEDFLKAMEGQGIAVEGGIGRAKAPAAKAETSRRLEVAPVSGAEFAPWQEK